MGDAYVWVDPGRQGGSPCIGGTRIPTSMVPDYVRHCGVEGMAGDYGLTPRQVITALWYEAAFGQFHHLRKWQQWAAEAELTLWHVEVEKLPQPPEWWTK